MPNVIPMIKKVFSRADRVSILRATEAHSIIMFVSPTFGISDEGDEYCVIQDLSGAVRCHIHIPGCGGYSRDHYILGYDTFSTLEELLLCGLPDKAQEIFKQKKEQRV